MTKKQERQNIDFLFKLGKAKQLCPVVTRATGVLGL